MEPQRDLLYFFYTLRTSVIYCFFFLFCLYFRAATITQQRITMSSGTIPVENEGHTYHKFKLSGELGSVEEIDLTIPFMIPKKSQVRIPQSNKKDYCRFRFPPLKIKLHPSSHG